MEMIYKGAEAEIWKTDYLGMPAIEKIRIPKNYRIPEIDEKIRKARIRKEANMIISARNAVSTPIIYDIDLKKMSITMEFIKGTKVRDIFYKGKNIEKISSEIGKAVKKMHSLDIIHNDLTTSNIILSKNKLYFIDFGLSTNSKSLEDKAVDVVVFKKMIKSTHWKYFEKIWESFKKSYADKKVLEKTKEVESRARYAEHE